MFRMILAGLTLAVVSIGAIACSPADRPQATEPTQTSELGPSPTPTEAPTATVPAPTSTPTAEIGQPIYGVSLSPLSYEQADFLNFLELAKDAGTALRGGSQWLTLSDPGQPASVVAQLASQQGLIPVIETSFFVQESGELTADVTDPEVRDEMVRIVEEFAELHSPEYFGLAVELNTLEETNEAAFTAFADELFPAAATAIRAVSPGTKVFVTFQLERLRGLRGGLFGGENDPGAADWSLLEKFPDADLISFTTYPMLIFGDPSEIPADYYSEVLQHTDKPVAFTEIGWFGDSTIPSWEADGEEQAAFIERFLEMIEPLDPVLVMWSFLFDQVAAPSPFESAGLFDNTGDPRSAWDAWRDAGE